jgi:hypothetical protein
MSFANNYHLCDHSLHLASQVVAHLNKAYSPHQDDDSHTNLAFDSLGQQIVGKWIHNEENSFLPAISLKDFSIHLYNPHLTSLFDSPLESKSRNETLDEICSFLEPKGFDSASLKVPMHYSITPAYVDNGSFSKPREDGIKSWIEVRTLANEACQQLLTHLQIESDVRIWPHHFDTGVYIEVQPNLGLGFGLATRDELANEAYFYFAPYALNGHKLDLNLLKTLPAGKWVLQDIWKGAVLPISQKDELSIFMRAAISSCLKL